VSGNYGVLEFAPFGGQDSARRHHRPSRPGGHRENVMTKRFLYICAGILCLAAAYHLGASNATAQGSPKGQIRLLDSRGGYVVIVSETDDIYVIDPERLPNVAKGVGWWKFRLDAVT
jgi:hypothetical protein